MLQDQKLVETVLIEPPVMKKLFRWLKIYHAYLMKKVLHVNPFLESNQVLWAAAMKYSHYSTLKQQMTCSAYPQDAAAHITD